MVRDQGRKCRILLVGAFLAIVGSAGLIQAVGEFREGETPQALEVFRRRPTSANLRAYERDLERQSYLAGFSRPWMQYLRFLAFQDAGEKAVIGRDDWWFYRQDVQYLVEPCPARAAGKMGREAAVEAAVSFRDQLAKRGIRLLVVPVPGKPGVYPEKLAVRANRRGDEIHGHTRQMIADLKAASVETVDLFEVLVHKSAGESYLARDTHWTPQGARAAAEAVARRVREMIPIRDNGVRSPEGGQGARPHGGQALPARYAVKQVTLHRAGDILHMIQVPQIEQQFEPETLACEQVIAANTGERYRDDPASDILVLGDSFLRIYERDEPKSAGFIAHLARELNQPLDSIVSDGGASTRVREELACEPARLAHKRLVVWEFIERDIRFGMEGWQDVALSDR